MADSTPTAGGAALDAMAEALRPFARVAEVDIGVDETDDDIFQQSNPNYAKAPRVKVGDFRRAAAILARIAERGTGSQAAPHSQTLEKGVSSEQAAPGCGRLREGVQEAIRCLEAIAGRMEKDGSPEIARGIDVGVSGLRDRLARLTDPQARPAAAAFEWKPVKTAPYNQEVEVRVGMMCFRAMLVQNGALDEKGNSCDRWIEAREGEHPPCWSDGACWESNEDLSPSLQLNAWRSLRSSPTPDSEASHG